MEDKMIMLLCIDGSDNADRAAKYTARLASCSRMKVTLLHVVPEKVAIEHLDDNKDVKREAIAHKIRFACDKLDEADVEYYESIQIGDPDEVIIDMATQYDGVIMGYKGHGFIETVFMGSVTEKVMRETKKPVILVP
jgi:nucleotide-binding universal stress UspA family protein